MIALAALFALAQATAEPPRTAAVVTAIDPARMALGKAIAGRLLPDGTYRRMMQGTLDQIVTATSQQTLNLSLRDLVAAAGLDAEQVRKLGPTTLRDVIEIVDPAYPQRMAVMARVMIEEMIPILTTMEPNLRDGFAEALATRYDRATLEELNGFFASPVGARYAADAMTLGADPAVMSRLQSALPRLTQAMPAMLKKGVEATASLPKAKTADQLSAADRQRLAVLLGVDPATFGKSGARGKP